MNPLQITSFNQVKRMQYDAVSGPTFDSVPPFDWAKSQFSIIPHVGQPNRELALCCFACELVRCWFSLELWLADGRQRRQLLNNSLVFAVLLSLLNCQLVDEWASWQRVCMMRLRHSRRLASVFELCKRKIF